MKYFLMSLLLAILPVQTAKVQHSAKYRDCKKACRTAHETAGAECKKKPVAEQQACLNAAKAVAAKCKQSCTE